MAGWFGGGSEGLARQKAEAACKEQQQQQQQQQRQHGGTGAAHQGLEEELRTKLQVVDSSPAGQEQQQHQHQQHQQQQEQEQQQQHQQQATEPVQGAGSTPGASFLPCAAFQGARAGYAFKKGDQGIGYYAEEGQQGSGQAGCGENIAAEGAGKHQPGRSTHRAEAGQQGEAQASHADTQQQQGEGQVLQAEAQQAAQQATQQVQQDGMVKEEEAIRQAEARLDAAAALRLGGGRVKLVPLLGTPSGVGGGPQEFGKLLSGKAKVCVLL
eukprot:1156265-Pelagomonas_calceolata.AAC.7